MNCMGCSPSLRHLENLPPKVLGTFESLDLRSNAVFWSERLLFICGRSVIHHLPRKALVTTKTEHFTTNDILSWDICVNFNRASNKIRNVSVSCMIRSKCTYFIAATHQAKNPPIAFFILFFYTFLLIIYFHAFFLYLLCFLEKWHKMSPPLCCIQCASVHFLAVPNMYFQLILGFFSK